VYLFFFISSITVVLSQSVVTLAAGTSGNWVYSGTYTTLRVEIYGGGGSGGGVTGVGGAGGGGGAGAYTNVTISVTNGQSFSYSVGSKGVASNTGLRLGAPGESSSFGSYSSAGGGAGGSTSLDLGTGVAGLPGGESGVYISNGNAGNYSGKGGNSSVTYIGGARRTTAGNGNAATATFYGAGGGGGFTNTDTDRRGGNGADGIIIISEISPLPIELLNFSITKIGRVNYINWNTVSEINNDYFTVERTTDGFDFEPIVKIDAVGNSNQMKTYQFEDLGFSSGINYYRLKQTDFDGKFTYSDLISVDNGVVSKTISRRINLQGKEVDIDYKGVVIIVYSDNSVLKTIQ
jgi:hypothetical protein